LAVVFEIDFLMTSVEIATNDNLLTCLMQRVTKT